MNPIERLKEINNTNFKTVGLNLEHAIKINTKSKIKEALFDCESLSIVESVKSRRILMLTNKEKSEISNKISILKDVNAYITRGHYNGTRIHS